MDPYSFDSLIASVKANNFDSGKLTELRKHSRGPFSAFQVRSILDMFIHDGGKEKAVKIVEHTVLSMSSKDVAMIMSAADFDRAKITILKTLRRHMVDATAPMAKAHIRSVFTFKSDKDKADAILDDDPAYCSRPSEDEPEFNFGSEFHHHGMRHPHPGQPTPSEEEFFKDAANFMKSSGQMMGGLMKGLFAGPFSTQTDNKGFTKTMHYQKKYSGVSPTKSASGQGFPAGSAYPSQQDQGYPAGPPYPAPGSAGYPGTAYPPAGSEGYPGAAYPPAGSAGYPGAAYPPAGGAGYPGSNPAYPSAPTASHGYPSNPAYPQ